jgi:glutamate/tyrosine decarboxylase-like PLP-dependent enzyme
MITDDIKLAKRLYKLSSLEEDIEPLSNGLSITTLRYVPKDINASTNNAENYLNILNKEILSRIQKTGKLYPSNAVVNGKFALRFCIVNFRTSIEDIYSVLPIVKRIGKETDRELRKRHGRSA